jgi:hypothetical protein
MDPASGRFASVDPFVGKVGKPVSLHRYLFADASPFSSSDPTGKFTLTSVLTGVSVRGILISVSIAVGATFAPLLKNLEIPTRMNHNTEWATVGLIAGGGFDAPSGVNYFTPDWYASGEEARRRLALDKTPDVVINLLIYPRKDRLKPHVLLNRLQLLERLLQLHRPTVRAHPHLSRLLATLIFFEQLGHRHP